MAALKEKVEEVKRKLVESQDNLARLEMPNVLASPAAKKRALSEVERLKRVLKALED